MAAFAAWGELHNHQREIRVGLVKTKNGSNGRPPDKETKSVRAGFERPSTYNGFVRWTPPRVIVMAALLTVLGLGYQSPVSSTDQKPSDLLKLNQEEAMDAYKIYSLLLRRWRPEIKEWRIVAETRAFMFCLKPTQEFTATYGAVLEDYALKNRRTFILERGFSIGDYTLATPQEWTDMQSHRVLATLSAIGFNPDRTRAGACYAVGNYHANSGMCMFLFKQDGTWKYDTGYREGCGFGGGIFE